MTLARRLAAHFVAPPDDGRLKASGERRPRRAGATATAAAGRAATRSAVAERPPPAVALLAPPADAPAVGAALGLAVARAVRNPAAVVCIWSPGSTRAGWRAPALPAAARIASALRERGHDATASGRLVVVRLSACGEEAASQALRVSAAAGTAPTVLALGGPRAAAFEALLAMQDLVVVAVAAAADESLARLASAGLERALTCAVPPADPARALAAAGVALLPSTRRVLAAAVGAVA